MAASNALGDRKPMFVIGKSLNLRPFKGVKNKPCRCRARKKAWLNSDLFEEWVRKLDCKFQPENRKIALIVDYCPVYSDVSELKGIELVFLPSNATYHTEPIDDCVIWSLKSKYSFISQTQYYCS